MSQENEEYEITTYESFDHMKLNEKILHGIYSYGFEKPSAIQKKAIVPFIQGKDLIAQSQSGTGKTGTFVIGVLQNIDVDKKVTQALILSPTRELAKQIHDVLEGLGKFSGITSRLVIGGNRRFSRFDSDDTIRDQVIVGTPGRI